MNELNKVHINDQTNQGNLLKDEVEDARVHISSRTNMTLAYADSCAAGTSQVSAKLMNSNVLAATTGVDPTKCNCFYHDFLYGGPHLFLSSHCAANSAGVMYPMAE